MLSIVVLREKCFPHQSQVTPFAVKLHVIDINSAQYPNDHRYDRVGSRRGLDLSSGRQLNTYRISCIISAANYTGLPRLRRSSGGPSMIYVIISLAHLKIQFQCCNRKAS